MKASFQSIWLDVDDDGWQDIFVINDFMPGNALFRNNHDGTFTDISVERGLFEGPEHCMSISMSDFDVDGDQDIFMTNTGIYPQVNNARQMLMVNDGTGNYTESSNAFGLDVFEWGWGGSTRRASQAHRPAARSTRRASQAADQPRGARAVLHKVADQPRGARAVLQVIEITCALPRPPS